MVCTDVEKRYYVVIVVPYAGRLRPKGPRSAEETDGYLEAVDAVQLEHLGPKSNASFKLTFIVPAGFDHGNLTGLTLGKDYEYSQVVPEARFGIVLNKVRGNLNNPAVIKTIVICDFFEYGPLWHMWSGEKRLRDGCDKCALRPANGIRLNWFWRLVHALRYRKPT